ncbi:MAG: thioredoxin family protein [Saprospiraceae bacterium]|nr:thioredoxin family protein [Saprospiraceae bacterium]
MKKIIGLVVLLAAAGVAYSFMKKDKAAADAYQVGDVVDDFALKNIDGETLSMASYEDAKGFVLVFTCNTCPYSQMYEQRLIDMDQKHSANGWQVIAINPNDPDVRPGDSFEAMQARAKEYGYTFPYLFDDGQEVYPKWGASRTPHVFLVEKTAKGNVLQYIGAIDDSARDASKVTVNYVDDAISALEAGNAPEVTFTKAIGCSIKTK